MLDDYAGSRRRWDVTLDSGKVTISGAFADDAERSVVTALARTVAGVTSVDHRQTTGISLAWND